MLIYIVVILVLRAFISFREREREREKKRERERERFDISGINMKTCNGYSKHITNLITE